MEERFKVKPTLQFVNQAGKGKNDVLQIIRKAEERRGQEDFKSSRESIRSKNKTILPPVSRMSRGPVERIPTPSPPRAFDASKDLPQVYLA